MPAKKLLKFITASACTIVGLPIQLAAWAAVPTIIDVTSFDKPGDLISIQGENFGDNPKIIGRKGSQKFSLDPVNFGNGVVHAQLPLDIKESGAQLTLQIANGDLLSAPVRLNGPKADVAKSSGARDRVAVIQRGYCHNIYNIKTDPRLKTHARGDGMVNDQPALEAAIQAAVAAGGGIVFLPAGKYKLQKDSGPLLDIKGKVTVSGAGAEHTQLLYGFGRPGPNTHLAVFSDAQSSGLANLTMIRRDEAAWHEVGTIACQGNCQNVFLSRIDCDIEGGKRIEFGGRQNVIEGCQLKSINTLLFMSGSKDCIVSGNVLKQSGGVHLDLTASEGCLVRNNQFILEERSKSAREAQPSVVRHGMAISFARDLKIIGNRFSAIEGAGACNNDGEAILSEGGGGMRADEEMGRVLKCEAKANSLELAPFKPAIQPTNNKTNKNEFTGYARPIIAIVSGPGLGQWQEIKERKDNRIEVDAPWAVTPDGHSNYAIFHWSSQNLIVKNNIFSGWPRGIWLYQAATVDTIIESNTLSKMDGIFIEPCQNTSRGQFDPFWRNIIKGNKLESGTRASYICIAADLQNLSKESANLHGVLALNNTIRDNVLCGRRIKSRDGQAFNNDPPNFESFSAYLRVEAPSEKFLESVSSNAENAPAIFGTIMQNNRATGCNHDYCLNGGSYVTTVKLNRKMDKDSASTGKPKILDDRNYWNTRAGHGTVSLKIM